LLKAAQQIKPNLVGIIMTGHGTISTAVEAMKSGASDYVLKPFTLRAVLPVLTRAMAVRRLRLENAALARSVSERTRELEAANKELESFSYSVSHDLQSPLRAISGFAELLVQDCGNELPDMGRRYLKVIRESTLRMKCLIDDLLTFSRFSRQPISKQHVNVGELVNQTVEDLRRDLGTRPIEIKIGLLQDCEADRSLLQQLFVNLLSNAFKFTRTRNPATIEVGFREDPPDRIYYVRDNGVGFDVQHADKLFSVFHRLHNDSEFEGTGVGLSIVQRIVQRHGGRIWAEAKPDKGATFYFTISPAGPP